MNSIENTTDFENLIQQDKPILLDFFAEWCGPCQALLPTVEKLSDEFKGDMEIRTVNVDQNPELAAKFGVRSIPALFFIKGNEVIDRVVGMVPEESLRTKINTILQPA